MIKKLLERQLANKINKFLPKIDVTIFRQFHMIQNFQTAVKIIFGNMKYNSFYQQNEIYLFQYRFFVCSFIQAKKLNET